MNTKIKSDLSFLFWLVLIMLVGWVIGFFTKDMIASWYGSLKCSPLSPPDYVFGIMWSVLYVLISLSGKFIWSLEQSLEVKAIRRLYILQIILNWSWTIVFFYYHATGIAFLNILSIVYVIFRLLMKVRLFSKIASLLLLPYLCWMVFISYLNAYIYLYN